MRSFLAILGYRVQNRQADSLVKKLLYVLHRSVVHYWKNMIFRVYSIYPYNGIR